MTVSSEFKLVILENRLIILSHGDLDSSDLDCDQGFH